MATRFYLPDTGAAMVSPAYDAAWERTADADRVAAVTAKSSTAHLTRLVQEPTADETESLARQYVSAPIDAATIAGTVKGQVRVAENDAAANARAQLIIRVVSNDGSTVRGTLLDPDMSIFIANEFALTLTNRKFPKGWAGAGAALTSVVAQQGDRIVIEIGVHVNAGPISTDEYQFRFGDTGATDLPEDETTTADNVPWIELSQTLTFAVPGGTASIAAAASVQVAGSGPDYALRALLSLPDEKNLTDRVRTWSTKRGRQDLLSRIEAGTCATLLKNGEGAPLDPGNVGSPYYPYVRAGTELRLDRRKAGVRYPLFLGRVERFIPTWIPPNYQEQQAVASDAFEGMAGFHLASSRATMTTALAGANNDLVYTAKEEGGRGDDITIAYVVAGNSTALGGATNKPVAGKSYIEVSSVSKATTQGLGGLAFLFSGSSQAAQAPQAFEISGSEIAITVGTDGAGAANSTAAQVKAFIEATPVLAALVSVAHAPGNTGAGVVAAMAATPLSGGKWVQELSGTRISRVLDSMGWPATLRRIDAGLCAVVTQGFAKRDKVSAISHIQDVAESELGYFFMAADGYATYHDGGHRGRVAHSTSVQATFADAQAGAGYKYTGIAPEYSKDKVYNRVSVTAGYQGAEPQVVEDAASQLLYSPISGVPLPRDYSKATLLAVNADALSVAQTLLAAFKDAKVRFEQISLLERADEPGWIESVQSRDVGDLIELRTKPPGHEVVGVYQCYIEQVETAGQPGKPVQVTFTLSLASEALNIPVPGGPLLDSSGDQFILDSATAGVLG